MQLGLRAALLVSGFYWKRWEHLTRDPRAAQSQLLLQLIRRNQSSAFGQDHGFDKIRTADEYRKQVPISDYERFRPYIDRAKLGESAVLTTEPILMFTMTSGSTGEPKLIPVTDSTRANHSKLTKLWYSRAFHDHPRCGDGKVFGLVGAAVEGRTAGGIPYGAASGLIYRSSPGWIRHTHALPYEIAEIKDFQAKYYVAMRFAVEQNITFLGTPNPSTILRLVGTADRYRDDIVRDIHDGTLSSRFDVATEIRAALAPQLSPNRERARELTAIIQKNTRLRPLDYWPYLELIGCWKGGTVGVRLTELDTWFGAGVAIRDLGYMASEAQMSLPIADTGCDGILAVDANFYEFIPEAEIGSANPTPLTCDELEMGGVYYVILTTGGGLYRYDINDLIRVAGVYGKTPRIEFLRKGRDVTNITGEKLHVNQVIQAMAQAQSRTGVVVQHFRAFADVERSRYAFLVEFDDSTPTDKVLAQLLRELDARLRDLNIEYAQKRESQRLKAPVLWLMKSGWFERKAGTGLQRGGRDTQFKAQLLSAQPEDSSEIMLVFENTDTAPNVSQSN
jgi:hypothetical protein